MSNFICCKCNENISSRTLKAMGKYWHPEHFICKDCKLRIREPLFNIQAEEPVCMKCFAKNYADLCFACHLPIMKGIVKALGKTWHAKCFKFRGTFGCDEPYCKAEYEQLFANHCVGCQKPITANQMTGMFNKWHRECFKCTKCQKIINNKMFVFKQGVPICLSCI